MASTKHAFKFVDEHRAELIQRVTMVMPLADSLLTKGMLHKEAYDEIMAERTSQDKMRRLFATLDSGGDRMKSFFVILLQKHERLVLQDLKNNGRTCKKRRNSKIRKSHLASCQMQMQKRQKIKKRRRRNTGEGIMKYKERLLSEYDTFQEYNGLPGEQVPLVDRYTKLLIIQQHRKKEEKEEELRSRGQRHNEVLRSRCSKNGSSTRVEQLFHPDDHGRIPKTVILQGDSGYGKSFTVQKIVYDWACGNLYQDQFELVLHLKCKELNLLSGEKNVMQLLNCSSNFLPVVKQMVTNRPEKVLFIIDGFDELKFSLENYGNKTSSLDTFKTAPVEATLSALFSGHILQKSYLLVTTRSTALDRLSKLLHSHQRFTEILGFSETAVKEYFKRFFKDSQMADEAYRHVQGDVMLSAACSIPVVCWIICTTFKEHVEEGKGHLKGLEATTSIFLHFVSLLLEHHCQGLHQPAITLLRSLAKLAKSGILRKQVLFEEKRVVKAASDPTSVPFLCKFLVRKKTGVETMFSFMHLSFQEFFTALHYIITDDMNAKRKLENRLPYGHHTFTDNPELLKKPDTYNSDFLAVIPFLFGLSNKEGTKLLMQNYKISIPPTIRSCLEEWILKFIEDMNDLLSARFEDFILHCLYELHEEQFVQKAMESWGKIDMSGYFVSDMGCWTLKYCILCCSSVKGLYVWIKTIEQLRILQPALHRCEELRLTLCDLCDADVGDLISALEDRAVITELTISRSSLSDHSLQQILTSVSSQHSLQRISLSVETITSSTMATFLQFVQNKKIGLAELNSCNDDSCCVSHSLWRNNTKSYRLTAGHHYFYTRDSTADMTENSIPQTSDPALSLSFSESTENSSADWMTLLQMFHKLKHLNQSHPEYKDEMEALQSSLCSTPHLTSLTLEVTCLDLSWAVRTLSLHQTCPGLANIRVVEQLYGNEQSVCSCLSVRKMRDRTASCDVYTLCFQNMGVGHRLILNESTQTAALLRVTLTLPLSSKMSSFDWRDFLQKLQLMKNTNPAPDQHQDAFLAVLYGLPDLQMVDMHIPYLTKTWAQGVISLIQSCLSIKQLNLKAEFIFYPHGQEGLQLLRNSKTRSDCTLTVQGYQWNKTTDHCSDNENIALRCSQHVVITIKGETVEECVSSGRSFSEEASVQDFESDTEVSDWETEENALARPEDQQAQQEDSFTLGDAGSLLEQLLSPTKL